LPASLVPERNRGKTVKIRCGPAAVTGSESPCEGHCSA